MDGREAARETLVAEREDAGLAEVGLPAVQDVVPVNPQM
jgi:hypothetical protein